MNACVECCDEYLLKYYIRINNKVFLACLGGKGILLAYYITFFLFCAYVSQKLILYRRYGETEPLPYNHVYKVVSLRRIEIYAKN